MSDHFVILADRGHLRIFQHKQSPEQMSPSLQEIQALDSPHGVRSYVQGDTDMAGRFQSSKKQGRGPGAPTARTGMSIDERLPMKEEEERRRVHDVASRIDAFLKNNPDASWDFAAGPTIHNAVLKDLSPPVRARLQHSVAKDLIHQPVPELLSHFSAR